MEIIGDVAAVLDGQHVHGRVHGGLTPHHILIDEQSHARFVAYDPCWALVGPVCARAYHAPEQWRGQTVDARADQYALAVIAYELLTGHRRLDAPVLSGIQTLEAVDVFADVPLQPGAGLHVNAALRRALSARPGNRYATVGEFAWALAAAPSRNPHPWRAWFSRLAPPVAISAAVAILVLALLKTNPRPLRWLHDHTPPAVQRALTTLGVPSQ